MDNEISRRDLLKGVAAGASCLTLAGMPALTESAATLPATGPGRPFAAQIPTITVVDDTFDGYRNAMAEIIARAKQRAGIA